MLHLYCEARVWVITRIMVCQAAYVILQGGWLFSRPTTLRANRIALLHPCVPTVDLTILYLYISSHVMTDMVHQLVHAYTS